jgi:hypothetical protein
MLLTAAAVAIAAPAAAQDFSQSPTYGTVSLSAGFTPDPRRVNVVAGGSNEASNISSRCAGFIADAPDVRLRWNGGGSLPLIFTTRSSSDTTLVINGPDGRWYCDDDSGGGLNARVRFNNAQSGQYDIWVGAYRGDYGDAALLISELE